MTRHWTALAIVCLLCSCVSKPVLKEASIRTVSEVEANAEAALARYANPELAEAGFLDVTQAPYSADPTGREDATAAIQQALRDARDARLVTYLPPGRYLVSDTIEGVVGVIR